MPFRDVMSQDHAVQVLKRAWTGGKLHHGWLLAGPSGVGKTTLARETARLLVCDEPSDDGDSCGHCRSCRLVDHGGHPDVITVAQEEGKTRISVNQVRQLKARLEFAPHGAGGRAIIFERADAMTEEAQNALLKTLEEPTARTYLLLTTVNPSQMLATVRSRCTRLNLSPLPKATLMTILERARPEVDEVTLSLAASLSSGSATAAIDLADSGLQELTDLVDDVDGALSNRDMPRLLRAAEALAKDRGQMSTALSLIALYYRDVMYAAAGVGLDDLAFGHKAADVDRRARALGARKAGDHVAAALEASEALTRRNANARLTAEAMLLRMLT